MYLLPHSSLFQAEASFSISPSLIQELSIPYSYLVLLTSFPIVLLATVSGMA